MKTWWFNTKSVQLLIFQHTRLLTFTQHHRIIIQLEPEAVSTSFVHAASSVEQYHNTGIIFNYQVQITSHFRILLVLSPCTFLCNFHTIRSSCKWLQNNSCILLLLSLHKLLVSVEWNMGTNTVPFFESNGKQNS